MKNIVNAEKYKEFCAEVCRVYGLRDDVARVTANMLVRTDMLGILTHGTYSLKAYLDKIEAGGTNKNSVPEVVTEGPAWAIIDGHNGMATYINYYGLNLAIDKAKSTGVYYVGIRGSGHYGAPGTYAIHAAEQGMFAIVMSNTCKAMTAPGTRGSTIGINPIAYGIPCLGRRPIFFDIGLSTVAGTKIKRIVDSGAKKLPDGWAVDEEGKPTNDATTLSKLFPTTMAGHKGFGLSLLVDVMCAVISGGGLIFETKLWRIEDAVPDTSHAILMFDVSAIIGIDNFEKRIKMTTDDYLASPKAESVNKLYLPGDKEWEHYEEALINGLELPDDILIQMIELAKITGVDFKSCLIKG